MGDTPIVTPRRRASASDRASGRPEVTELPLRLAPLGRPAETAADLAGGGPAPGAPEAKVVGFDVADADSTDGRGGRTLKRQTSVRDVLYPGRLEERLRYIGLRFLPAVYITLWLLIPLGARDCNGENFFTFTFGALMMYLLPAVSIAWSAYNLIVAPVPWKIIVPFTVVLGILCLGALNLARFAAVKPEENVWSLIIAGSVVGTGGLLLGYFLLRSWWLQRKHRTFSVRTPNPLYKDDSVGSLAMTTEMNPQYVALTLRVIIPLGMFLIVFIVSQAFSYGFSVLVRDEGVLSFRQFAVLLFTVLMTIVKVVMEALGTRLDLALKQELKLGRVMFCYIADLFYFFFNRSLFINISRYEIFVPLAALGLVGDLIMTPIKTTRLYFVKITKLVNFILRSKDPYDEAAYNVYKEEQFLDFFFRAIAQSTSLMTFTVAFATVFFYHNKPYFSFPDVIEQQSDYGISNAVVFITYMPISLFFELFNVIILRRYFTWLLGHDSFKFGVAYLKHNNFLVFLFLSTVHIGQDVFIAKNRFNFC